MAKRIAEDLNKDVIMAYLRDPDGVQEVDLTRKQQSLLTWYVDAYTFMRQYNSVPDTIQVMVKLGAMRGDPISTSTARRYIYDALELFGKASKMKAEAISHLAVEILLDAIAMAKQTKNPSAMIAGVKELRAVAGEDDPNAISKEDLQQHQVVISIPPESERMLKKLIKGGVVDFDLLNGMAEEVIFEEVRKDGQSE